MTEILKRIRLEENIVLLHVYSGLSRGGHTVSETATGLGRTDLPGLGVAVHPMYSAVLRNLSNLVWSSNRALAPHNPESEGRDR
jgi:hypothetical protein